MLSFEKRKKDHIRLALDEKHQAVGRSGLDSVELPHDAIPEMNWSDVDLRTEVFGQALRAPLFIAGMTAGHDEAPELNQRLASACEKRGWMLGVGSQRRDLEAFIAGDHAGPDAWHALRERHPDLLLVGNIGLSQILDLPAEKMKDLFVDRIGVTALAIHLNPLQEVFQPEGTPQFRNGLAAITRIAETLPVPVLIKETGCGFSTATLEKIKKLPIAAVDVSGLGGTHWGRIEGTRAAEAGHAHLSRASEVFSDWGISTTQSLLNARSILGPGSSIQVLASGGLRSGLDAAKTIAMGATCAGFASPALAVARKGETFLEEWMSQIEFELKVALFCTGSRNVRQLNGRFKSHS